MDSVRVLEPGKEGRATVQLNPASQAGEIIKTATLHTNDPAKPIITLTVAANVMQSMDTRRGSRIGPIYVSPDTTLSLYVPEGQAGKKELTLSVVQPPVKITGVEGNDSKINVRLETVEEGKTYRLVAEAGPGLAAGAYLGQVNVLTDNIMMPYFKVKLFARVLPK